MESQDNTPAPQTDEMTADEVRALERMATAAVQGANSVYEEREMDEVPEVEATAICEAIGENSEALVNIAGHAVAILQANGCASAVIRGIYAGLFYEYGRSAAVAVLDGQVPPNLVEALAKAQASTAATVGSEPVGA